MVLSYVQPPAAKGEGEYPLVHGGWANAYDHPLHGLVSRRQAQPEVHAQKQPYVPIEQEEHYVAIVRGRDGRDHLRSSASLKHVKKSVLSKAFPEFREAVHRIEAIDYAQSSNGYKERQTSQEQDASHVTVDPDTGSISFPFRRKRARANTESGNVLRSLERGSKTARVQARQNGEKKLIYFQLSDEEGLKQWYIEAFEAVQQVTCRTIAKLWIKKIEPKKQSAHPYNGGLPKEEPKDPERTKPKYWPDNIPHKEPDHIQKNQRVTLLTHLIINTPHQQLVPKDKTSDMIGAADLEAQSAERKNDFPPDKWEILQHIFRVRQLQEAYLSGGQDGATFVYVPDCSKATRLEQGEPVKDVEDVEVDGPLSTQASDGESEETEHVGQAMLTPASSTMTSPVDPQHIPSQNMIVTNSASSSFSHQNSDVSSHPEPVRGQITGYENPLHQPMADQMMERRPTNGMMYAHRQIAQPSYSQLPVSHPQYPPQPMHPSMEHNEYHVTHRWLEFDSDTFNRASHADAPVQSETMMAGYGVFSTADMGNMATISNSLPCTEDFCQSQVRMEQMHQQLQQQNLDHRLTSQASRDIPYRSASAQSAQQMSTNRHNNYDDDVLHSSFYHQL